MQPSSRLNKWTFLLSFPHPGNKENLKLRKKIDRVGIELVCNGRLKAKVWHKFTTYIYAVLQCKSCTCWTLRKRGCIKVGGVWWLARHQTWGGGPRWQKAMQDKEAIWRRPHAWFCIVLRSSQNSNETLWRCKKPIQSDEPQIKGTNPSIVRVSHDWKWDDTRQCILHSFLQIPGLRCFEELVRFRRFGWWGPGMQPCITFLPLPLKLINRQSLHHLIITDPPIWPDPTNIIFRRQLNEFTQSPLGS